MNIRFHNGLPYFPELVFTLISFMAEPDEYEQVIPNLRIEHIQLETLTVSARGSSGALWFRWNTRH